MSVFEQIDQRKTQSTSSYPRMNLQSGDKKEQVFYLKLLPRIPLKDPRAPWHTYNKHHNCGPAMDKNFICLNIDEAERKKNRKNCVQCMEDRKVLFNKDQYDEKRIEKAKKQAANGRVNWPVFDLDKRKRVEMLERASVVLDDIIDLFKEKEKRFDLTDLRAGYALKVKRVHSGISSKYTYSRVEGDEYKLTKEDIAAIIKTYIAPEQYDPDEVLDIDAIRELVSEAYGVQVEAGESAADASVSTTPASEQDIETMLGGGASAPAQQEKPKENPIEKPKTVSKPAEPSISEVDLLLAQIQ